MWANKLWNKFEDCLTDSLFIHGVRLIYCIKDLSSSFVETFSQRMARWSNLWNQLLNRHSWKRHFLWLWHWHLRYWYWPLLNLHYRFSQTLSCSIRAVSGLQTLKVLKCLSVFVYFLCSLYVLASWCLFILQSSSKIVIELGDFIRVSVPIRLQVITAVIHSEKVKDYLAELETAFLRTFILCVEASETSCFEATRQPWVNYSDEIEEFLLVWLLVFIRHFRLDYH